MIGIPLMVAEMLRPVDELEMMIRGARRRDPKRKNQAGRTRDQKALQDPHEASPILQVGAPPPPLPRGAPTQDAKLTTTITTSIL